MDKKSVMDDCRHQNYIKAGIIDEMLRLSERLEKHQLFSSKNEINSLKQSIKTLSDQIKDVDSQEITSFSSTSDGHSQAPSEYHYEMY